MPPSLLRITPAPRAAANTVPGGPGSNTIALTQAFVLPAAFAQVRPLFVLMRIPRDPLASRCAVFAGSTATAQHDADRWSGTPSLSAFQVRPRSPLRNTPR